MQPKLVKMLALKSAYITKDGTRIEVGRHFRLMRDEADRLMAQFPGIFIESKREKNNGDNIQPKQKELDGIQGSSGVDSSED